MASWLYKRTAPCADAAVGYCGSGTASRLVGTINDAGDTIELACISDAGTLLWQKSVGTQFSWVSSLLIAGGPITAHYYIAYRDDDAASMWMLMKIDAADGSVVWTRRGVEAGEVNVHQIVFGASGSPILIGSVVDVAERFVWAVRLAAADGATLYSRRYTYTTADLLSFGKGCAITDGSYVRVAGWRTSTSMYFLTLSVDTLAKVSAVTYDMSATATTSQYPTVAQCTGMGAPFVSWGSVLLSTPTGAVSNVLGSNARLISTGGNTTLMAVRPFSTTRTDALKINTSSGSFSSIDTAVTGFSGATDGQGNPKDVAMSSTEVTSVMFATVLGNVWAVNAPLAYSASLDGTYSGMTYGAGAVPSTGSNTAPSNATYTNTDGVGSVTISTPVTETTYTDTFTYSLEAMPAPPTTNGTIAGTLTHITSAFAAVTEGAVAMSLPAMTGSSAGTIEGMGGSLPVMQAALSGMDGFSASLPAVQGALTLSIPQNGTITGALPHVAGNVTGATTVSVAGVLPPVVAELVAVMGNEGGIAAKLPHVSTELVGGTQQNTFVLPVIRASFSGHIGVVAKLEATIRPPAAALSGTVAALGTIAGRLARVQADAAAVIGIIANITGELPNARANISGAAGITGTANASLGAVSASFGGSNTVMGTIGASLPIPRAALVLTYTATHALTQSMNTNTTAVTTFENYAYNSFANFGGQSLAAGPNGLYILDEGDTDDAALINATMKTGLLDFGSPQLKRMSDFYLAMRTTGDIKLAVSTDEAPPYEYDLKPYDVETLKQRRNLIGKGMRGRYWQFGITNTEGCDFEFDAYNMLVVDTSRRI